MTTPIILEKPYCKFTFLKAPKQVKKVADLPNWFVTVADKETGKAVKLYMQIQYDAGYPTDMQDALNAVDYIKALLKDENFIAQFGELVLNNWMQCAPTESENYRVSKEFYNFFQRRGRNVRTVMESVPGKRFNPITLGLENDLLFTTTQSHTCFKRNYKCISGTVNLLGQVHHFELSHPLFDLSMIMTAGDARKIVIAGLRKAFPFIDLADIKNWAFDNQVQGK
ncbi:hypothetical protein [Burkholderia phage FLC9]|nr:hypothetical protein [Burkholderia phage FLC9]